MFLSVPCDPDCGVFTLDRSGRLLCFSLKESNVVNKFKQKPQMAMPPGQYKEAAEIAAKAPQVNHFVLFFVLKTFLCNQEIYDLKKRVNFF